MHSAPNNQYAKKYDDETLNKLCKEFVEWAKNTNDLHLIDFADKYDKSLCWLNWLANNYPEFAKAKERVHHLLASKILKLSFLNKDVNAYVGMKYLGVYDVKYREYQKWQADIQKETVNKEQNRCVFNDAIKQLKEDKE